MKSPSNLTRRDALKLSAVTAIGAALPAGRPMTRTSMLVINKNTTPGFSGWPAKIPLHNPVNEIYGKTICNPENRWPTKRSIMASPRIFHGGPIGPCSRGLIESVNR